MLRLMNEHQAAGDPLAVLMNTDDAVSDYIHVAAGIDSPRNCKTYQLELGKAVLTGLRINPRMRLDPVIPISARIVPTVASLLFRSPESWRSWRDNRARCLLRFSAMAGAMGR